MAQKAGIDLEQPSFKELADHYSEGIGRLVFWGGAGLSVPAKLPTWIGLRDTLVRAARRKVETLDKSAQSSANARIASAAQPGNLWQACDTLWDILRQTSFIGEVRQALKGSDSCEVPAFYSQVWNLNIDGFVTLNLDGLAARGYAAAKKTPSTMFDGFGCGPWLSVLQSRKPFIITLHGRLDNPTSWVLRARDIKKIQESEDYKLLVSNLFGSKIVVFVGISAQDRGAGGLLESITRGGINLGTHFWLTSERGEVADHWAEAAGIRIIRYDAESTPDHEKCLRDFLSGLAKYKSREVDPPPVATPNLALSGALLAPEVLSKESPEAIRLQLNAAAARILETDEPPYRAFGRFCSKYQRALHYSWHVSLDDPDNVLFGYKIVGTLGSGAFGTVYRALDTSGQQVAIKLLREEIRADQSMLGSFRRGMKSMQILSNRRVKGMVSYFCAYELPPCVIMELVEGETLEAIIQGQLLEGIESRIRIAHLVAGIVNQAHVLPERVLHRDIRPSNIMVRDFYVTEAGQYDVVVLDFDLSWHKNALERSITTHAATALGYLAPEQLSPGSKYSTRHSAVDSFGLAMTLYFMISGRHPAAGDSQTRDWVERVYQSARSLPAGIWRCVPERLARLIIQASDADQKTRPDFSEVLSELKILESVCWTGDATDRAEIWAEEIFNRAFPGKGYTWDVERSSLTASFASGVQMTLIADDFYHLIKLEIDYTFTGAEKFKNVAKYLPPAVDKANSILRNLQWTIDFSKRGSQDAQIRASVALQTLAAARDQHSKGLAEVGGLFEFE